MILQGFKYNRFFDRFGATGSTLCLIHCFISAFIPSILAVLGVDAVLNSQFEWGFTAVAVGFALLALWSGYQKHNSKIIVFAFVLGISGLILSRVIEETSGHHDHHEVQTAAISNHHAEQDHKTSHENGFDWHLIGTIIGVGAGTSIIFAHFQSMKVTRVLDTKRISV